MEEILSNLRKLELYAKIKSNLDEQKLETRIDEREAEIENKKNELKLMSIGSKNAPVLKEEIEQAEETLNADKAEYMKKYSGALANFENDKGKLRNSIRAELNLYKRRSEIEAEKENVERLRSEAEAEFKQKNDEVMKDVNRLEKAKLNYQSLIEDTKKDIENARNALDREGVRNGEERLKGLEINLSQMDSKISAAQEETKEPLKALEEEMKKRNAEIDKQENKVNSYKAIEDNKDEISDLEYLLSNINSMSFEKASEIAQNQYVVKVKEKAVEEKQTTGQSIPNSQQGAQQTVEPTANPMQAQTQEPIQTTTQSSVQNPPEALTQDPTQATTQEIVKMPKQELAKVITPKIKGIKVGKGITIEYENGKVENKEIKLKDIKRLAKANVAEKLNMIYNINDVGTLNRELIDRIDPSIIYAFQEAINDGVSRDDASKVMNNYLDSLAGSLNAQSEIRGLISYDRTGMDYWKPSTFIDKIRNHRYYKEMARYIDEARDFVTVKEDKIGKIRKFLQERTTKLLDKGKEASENTKNVLGDTASMAKGIASAAKESAKDFRDRIGKVKEEVNNKGVSQQNNEPNEKATNQEEKIAEGDGEER